jgi:hypothetical protein
MKASAFAISELGLTRPNFTSSNKHKKLEFSNPNGKRGTQSNHKTGDPHHKKPRRDEEPKSSQHEETLCNRCGRKGHAYDACVFKSHPNANNDEHSLWADSAPGKAWSGKGKDLLPATKDLNDNTIPLPALLAEKHNKHNKQTHKSCKDCDCAYLSLLRDDTKTYANTIPITLVNNQQIVQQEQEQRITTQALLDTGALHANYIHSNVAQEVVHKGIASIVSYHLLCFQ